MGASQQMLCDVDDDKVELQLLVTNTKDVSTILYGLSYKVLSIVSSFFPILIYDSDFERICHYTLTVCATITFEDGL